MNHLIKLLMLLVLVNCAKTLKYTSHYEEIIDITEAFEIVEITSDTNFWDETIYEKTNFSTNYISRQITNIYTEKAMNEKVKNGFTLNIFKKITNN